MNAPDPVAAVTPPMRAPLRAMQWSGERVWSESRRLLTLGCAFSIFLAGGGVAGAEEPAAAPAIPRELTWAYPVTVPEPPPPPKTMSHPPRAPAPAEVAGVPEVVARGRPPMLRGCAECHRIDGQGYPHNSAVAGLPAEYILRQIADIHAGTRRCAEPRMEPPVHMVTVAQHVTPAEARAAAEYYAHLPFHAAATVVEAEEAPISRVVGMRVAGFPHDGTEPLGCRIVEVPAAEVPEALRSPGARFMAFVPRASLARGEELVRTGAGRTVQCAGCHGPELRGLDAAPPLAGRSPSYLARQLYDFQCGVRAGASADLMKPSVQHLTPADIVALAAYVGSLAP